MAGGLWLAGVELTLATIGLAPFAIHRLSVGRWAKEELICPEDDSNLDITVLLPVWNESLIIEQKLADLSAQSRKVSLLIVDSASDDDTVSKAETWLADFPKAFTNYEIVQMEKRLGKTPAVMLALDKLNQTEGIIVMTDADAFLSEGAFDRISKWFSNPTIGAVGGTPNRSGKLAAEGAHRDLFTLIRTGESSHDSTPFLEGSLLAWRAGSVSSSDLYPTANADDAQIATAVRLGGLRSIQDPNLFFTDQMPTTIKGQRRQKIRRAQGLIRLLARKRKYWFSRREGRFSTILRRNAWMHLFSPIAMAGVAILAILRNITYLPDSMLMWGLSAFEVYMILSWALARYGKSPFGMRTAGTITVGLEHLMAAIIASARGKSLHMWKQHSDVREEISKRIHSS